MSKNAIQHKLYLVGWPNAEAVRHWQVEIRSQLAQAHKNYRESMRREIEPKLADLLRLARLGLKAMCWTKGRR